MCQFTVANPMTGQTPRPRHVALLPPQKARTWSRLAVSFGNRGFVDVGYIWVAQPVPPAPLKLERQERRSGLVEPQKVNSKLKMLKPFQVYESMSLCFCVVSKGWDSVLIVLFRQPNHHRMKWQSIIQMICAQFEPPWLCLRHRWFSPSTSLMWCGLVAKPTW